MRLCVSVLAVALLGLTTAGASALSTENVYVDGQTYAINTGAAVIVDASEGLLASASPMYLIGLSVAAGTMPATRRSSVAKACGARCMLSPCVTSRPPAA